MSAECQPLLGTQPNSTRVLKLRSAVSGQQAAISLGCAVANDCKSNGFAKPLGTTALKEPADHKVVLADGVALRVDACMPCCTSPHTRAETWAAVLLGAILYNYTHSK